MFGPHMGYPVASNIMSPAMHAGRMMSGAGTKSSLGGLFSSLFGGAKAASATGAIKQGINWGGLLTNTHKTLGVINQAIPIFYQVGPIFNNAKTMFKIANAVKDVDSTPRYQESKTVEPKEEIKNEKNKPIFYL